MTPSISAVITSYNEEAYIADAIESVLSQTRPAEEVLVVDGGSTDGTREAVSNYPSVDLLLVENSNISRARNTGIERSTGDLIAFLDADDMWMEDKLKRQVAQFERDGDLGLVYTDFYRATPENEIKSMRRSRSLSDDRAAEQLFKKGAAIIPSSAMISRDCLSDVGAFDPSLPIAEDRELWFRIAAEWPVHRITDPLVRRREREGSLGSDIEGRVEHLEKMTEKMIEMYPRLERLRAKREAHLSYVRGSHHLNTGDTGAARRDLLDAVRTDPTLWRAYVRLLLSILPSGVAKSLSTGLRAMKYRFHETSR